MTDPVTAINAAFSNESVGSAAASVPGHTSNQTLRVTAPSTPDNKSRRWRWHWSIFVAIGLAGILFANRVAPFFGAAVDTLGNFRWQIVFLGMCLAIYQFIARRPVWGAVILVLLAVPALRMASLWLPARQPVSMTSELRLVSLNLAKRNQQYERAAQMIRDSGADIVCLIEYTDEWQTNLRETLREYPWHVGPVNGNVIFSKVPLEPFESRHIFFDPIPLLSAAARLEWEGQPVLVVCTHPTSPTTWERLRERDAQIQLLGPPVGQLQRWHHVVLAGDFNATVECRALRSLLATTGFRDTRQGFGLQSSWPTWFWPIAICIDQVFVSPGVHVHNRHTGPNVGSDHLPVTVDLSFGQHAKFLRDPAESTEPQPPAELLSDEGE
jgi:endonuclease/exonuclease/phosphatase (EEP) superfamily protein YafD